MGSVQTLKERFWNAKLTDDLFFGCFMNDTKIFTLVLQILTGNPNLDVDEVEMQHFMPNVGSHGCRLDAFGKNRETGMKVNVEMQCLNDDDHVKRVRYYAGTIDTGSLPAGAKFKELPDLYMIFITEKDFIKGRSAVYVVKRKAVTYDKREIPLENGIHEIYANLQEGCPAGEANVGMLLDFFRQPKEVKGNSWWLRELQDRYESISEGKDVEAMAQAGSIMKSILEEGREEGRKQGRMEGRKEGRMEGRKEGMEEASIELLVVLLEQGTPVEMAVKYVQKAMRRNEEEARRLVDKAIALNKKNSLANGSTLDEIQASTNK